MSERRRPNSCKKQINVHPKCGIRNSDRSHTVRPHDRDGRTLCHSSRPALHNADKTVKWQFVRLATHPVKRSAHERDISLSPAQRLRLRLRPPSTSCNDPRDCKIIGSNGVESLGMRRSNGAVQPSDRRLCCSSIHVSKQIRLPSRHFHFSFRLTWQILRVSRESDIAVCRRDSVLSHDYRNSDTFHQSHLPTANVINQLCATKLS